MKEPGRGAQRRRRHDAAVKVRSSGAALTQSNMDALQGWLQESAGIASANFEQASGAEAGASGAACRAWCKHEEPRSGTTDSDTKKDDT